MTKFNSKSTTNYVYKQNEIKIQDTYFYGTLLNEQ